jgi:hypothetical protein
MEVDERHLDGNAAAGALRELFVMEMTTARTTCGGCGDVGPIGALLEYGHAMGIVLRCPACDRALIRIARTPGSIRLDLSGVSVLAVQTDEIVAS